MKHVTNHIIHPQEVAPAPIPNEEFDVFLQGTQIVFSWNTKDISEIAHTMGEPEIDLQPCG